VSICLVLFFGFFRCFRRFGVFFQLVFHSDCIREKRECSPGYGDIFFIIAAEILAVTIRSREDIQGIMIGQKEFKLVQYADDFTLFVPNIECAKFILQYLDRFTIYSGLKVNHTKTEAMWIGSCRQNTATPLGLRRSKSVKALGIVFFYNDMPNHSQNCLDI